MSTLTVCNIVSLDGYYADTTGNPLVLPMDAAFDAYNLDLLRTADSLLLGANSYRMLMGFWPAHATNPDAGEVHREFDTRYGEIPATAISDSLVPEDVRRGTAIVRRADAETHVKALKRDGDVVTYASHVTWNALLAAGLVDELHLIVGPTVLGTGTGTPAFTSPVTGLGLAETRRLDGADNVLMRYTVSAGR